jgi:hypothetical protein
MARADRLIDRWQMERPIAWNVSACQASSRRMREWMMAERSATAVSVVT